MEVHPLEAEIVDRNESARGKRYATLLLRLIGLPPTVPAAPPALSTYGNAHDEDAIHFDGPLRDVPLDRTVHNSIRTRTFFAP